MYRNVTYLYILHVIRTHKHYNLCVTSPPIMFLSQELNTSVDPELAVCTGVALQAGIESHSWPLQVAALEVKTGVKKISL